ncbi:hypothetical protein PCANC_20098, partial [Puccinia coronata f. sp. avenae]
NHCQEFPVLSKIAKDYLACSATSSSVERCFSAASNICGRFKANGHFKTAQGIINQAMDKTSKAKAKPPIASTLASSLGKTKED